jgi:hypothetical protein
MGKKIDWGIMAVGLLRALLNSKTLTLWRLHFVLWVKSYSAAQQVG